MKSRNLKVAGAVAVAAMLASGCASLGKGEPDERWADYASWTKITEGRTGTGDPTGFIGKVHKGRDGYRDVFVNDIGKDTLESDGPYVFPVGTVIVKEQYDNKAAWESQKGAAHTVMVKINDGTGADSWGWAAGYTGKAGASAFCSGCHTIAAKDDFVFTHEKFLSSVE